jgi:hypothetical protein
MSERQRANHECSSFVELDALSTEELQERAFDRARERADVGFFWRLAEHLPAPDDGSDGSLGIQSTVDDAVAVWKESTGHEYGDREPLIRAAFIDYLLKH